MAEGNYSPENSPDNFNKDRNQSAETTTGADQKLKQRETPPNPCQKYFLELWEEELKKHRIAGGPTFQERMIHNVVNVMMGNILKPSDILDTRESLGVDWVKYSMWEQVRALIPAFKEWRKVRKETVVQGKTEPDNSQNNQK